MAHDQETLTTLKVKLAKLEKDQKKLERQRLRLAFSRKRKDELASLAVQIAAVKRQIAKIEQHARTGRPIQLQARIAHANMNRIAGAQKGKMGGGSAPDTSQTATIPETTSPAASEVSTIPEVPWYKRPTTFVVGGLALVTGILVYQSRKKGAGRSTT